MLSLLDDDNNGGGSDGRVLLLLLPMPMPRNFDAEKYNDFQLRKYFHKK